MARTKAFTSGSKREAAIERVRNIDPLPKDWEERMKWRSDSDSTELLIEYALMHIENVGNIEGRKRACNVILGYLVRSTCVCFILCSSHQCSSLASPHMILKSKIASCRNWYAFASRLYWTISAFIAIIPTHVALVLSASMLPGVPGRIVSLQISC